MHAERRLDESAKFELPKELVAEMSKRAPQRTDDFYHVEQWKPSFFGVKPEVVLKGGMIAFAQMGDANASIPTPQPVFPRPMFAAYGRANTLCSITFISLAALKDRTSRTASLPKTTRPQNCERFLCPQQRGL